MYTLDNGVALHHEFPDSFFIPNHEQKASVTVNSLVKLIFREEGTVERMWVLITQEPVVKNELRHFVGVLDNNPYELTSVKLGDVVEFTEDNIIQIYG